MDDPGARRAVAEALTAGTEGEGSPPWDELDAGTQGDLLALAGVAITAYEAWQASIGVRYVPPAAVLRPTSEAEARAMIKAAEAFLAGQKRKQGLIAGPGLVVPPGTRRH